MICWFSSFQSFRELFFFFFGICHALGDFLLASLFFECRFLGTDVLLQSTGVFPYLVLLQLVEEEKLSWARNGRLQIWLAMHVVTVRGREIYSKIYQKTHTVYTQAAFSTATHTSTLPGTEKTPYTIPKPHLRSFQDPARTCNLEPCGALLEHPKRRVFDMCDLRSPSWCFCATFAQSLPETFCRNSMMGVDNTEGWLLHIKWWTVVKLMMGGSFGKPFEPFLSS